MDLRYNYGFFSRFISENRINKKDILDALGTKDYTTLNRWIEGLNPIATETILRLCNTYDIPLSSFFCNMEGPITMRIEAPENENMQLLANGGYDSARRNTTDPRPTCKVTVKWPVNNSEAGAMESRTGTEKTSAATPAKNISRDVNTELEIMRVKLQCEERVNRIKDECEKRVQEVKSDYAQRVSERREDNKGIVEMLQQEIKFLRDLLKKNSIGYTLPENGYVADCGKGL